MQNPAITCKKAAGVISAAYLHIIKFKFFENSRGRFRFCVNVKNLYKICE